MILRFLVVICLLIKYSFEIFLSQHGEIVTYELNVTSKDKNSNDKELLDFTHRYLLNDTCSAYTEVLYHEEMFKFEANLIFYESSNNNVRFMLNITFKNQFSHENDNAYNGSSKEYSVIGYQILFEDTVKQSFSCVEITSAEKFVNYGEKFQLLIKDPIEVEPETQYRNKYIIYYGRITVIPIIYRKKERNIEFLAHNSPTQIDVGLLNAEYSDFRVDSLRRDDETLYNCEASPINYSCAEPYHDEKGSAYIIIQKMPEWISSISNKFGKTQDYHPSIISYEHELIRNVTIKIVSDIDPKIIFHFHNFFLAPSTSNTCASGNYTRDFCKCDGKCVTCENISTACLVMQLEPIYVHPKCSITKQFKGINMTPYKRLITFQNELTNTSNRTELCKKLAKLIIVINRTSSSMYDMAYKLHDRYFISNNKNLKIEYRIKIYQLSCETSGFNQILRKKINLKDCRKKIILEEMKNDDYPSILLNIQTGKYLFEIEHQVSYNHRRLCIASDECPYLVKNKIYCEECSKRTKYIDLAVYNETSSFPMSSSPYDLLQYQQLSEKINQYKVSSNTAASKGNHERRNNEIHEMTVIFILILTVLSITLFVFVSNYFMQFPFNKIFSKLRFKKTHVMVYFSIDVQDKELTELEKNGKNIFELLKNELSHIEFDYISNCCYDWEIMTNKFEKSDLIVYVCKNESEINRLVELNGVKKRTGKSAQHDHFNRMHTSEKLKSKTISIVLNKDVAMNTLISSVNKSTASYDNLLLKEQNIIFLYNKSKDFVRHLIQMSIKNDSCWNLWILKVYQKHAIKCFTSRVALKLDKYINN